MVEEVSTSRLKSEMMPWPPSGIILYSTLVPHRGPLVVVA